MRALLAILGRPNVGKSTLFNRIAGRRLALVQDVPGVTRDRHYADAEWQGRPLAVVDTGGFVADERGRSRRAGARPGRARRARRPTWS